MNRLLADLIVELTDGARTSLGFTRQDGDPLHDAALVRYVLTALVTDDELAEHYDRVRWTQWQVPV